MDCARRRGALPRRLRRRSSLRPLAPRATTPTRCCCCCCFLLTFPCSFCLTSLFSSSSRLVSVLFFTRSRALRCFFACLTERVDCTHLLQETPTTKTRKNRLVEWARFELRVTGKEGRWLAEHRDKRCTRRRKRGKGAGGDDEHR